MGIGLLLIVWGLLLIIWSKNLYILSLREDLIEQTLRSNDVMEVFGLLNKQRLALWEMNWDKEIKKEVDQMIWETIRYLEIVGWSINKFEGEREKNTIERLKKYGMKIDKWYQK